jgi:hypothetical protein
MRSAGSRATCERPSKDDDTTELTRNDLDSYDWAARASAALAREKKVPPGSMRSEEEAAIMSEPRQDRSRTRCDGKGGTESSRRLSGGYRHHPFSAPGIPGNSGPKIVSPMRLARNARITSGSLRVRETLPRFHWNNRCTIFSAA